MGLASYGKPEYLSQMREIVHLLDDGSFRLNLEYFHHHKKRLNYEWEGGNPNVGTLFSDSLIELLGPRRTPEDELEDRHWNIAHSVQAMYEEAFFHLLNRLQSRRGKH